LDKYLNILSQCDSIGKKIRGNNVQKPFDPTVENLDFIVDESDDGYVTLSQFELPFSIDFLKL